VRINYKNPAVKVKFVSIVSVLLFLAKFNFFLNY